MKPCSGPDAAGGVLQGCEGLAGGHVEVQRVRDRDVRWLGLRARSSSLLFLLLWIVELLGGTRGRLAEEGASGPFDQLRRA